MSFTFVHTCTDIYAPSFNFSDAANLKLFYLNEVIHYNLCLFSLFILSLLAPVKFLGGGAEQGREVVNLNPDRYKGQFAVANTRVLLARHIIQKHIKYFHCYYLVSASKQLCEVGRIYILSSFYT